MTLPTAPNITNLVEWRKAAKAGNAPASPIVRKQYIADQIKAAEEGSRKLTFTITTGAVDRDRDTVRVDGWDFANWLKNPVVLWAHQYSHVPVAKGESIITSAGAVKATAEFPERDLYPFGDMVFRLLLEGYLRATSVGFVIGEWKWDEERSGLDILKQELLEYSIVPVPANPEALMDAKGAGIDLSPLKAWAEEVLDGATGPGLWVPKEQALEAFRVLGEPRVTVPAAGEKGPDPECRSTRLHVRRCESCWKNLGASKAPEQDDKGAPTPETKPPAETFTFTPDSLRGAVRTALEEAALAQVSRATGRID